MIEPLVRESSVSRGGCLVWPHARALSVPKVRLTVAGVSGLQRISVLWEGPVGERRPYADQTPFVNLTGCTRVGEVLRRRKAY